MEDPEEGVRQPLLRRMSSRMNERAQFREAQGEVAVNVAQEGEGIVARLLFWGFVLVCTCLAGLWAYLYLGSIYIIIYHLDEPCDQPLGLWLLFWFVLPTICRCIDPPPPSPANASDIHPEELAERNRHSFRQGFVHAIWFIQGMLWFYQSKTCQKTNAPLYFWVKFVVHIYVIGGTFFIAGPLMLAFIYLQMFRFYQMLIAYGWVSNPKAARADTIENLEVVAFDPLLFAPEDDLSDKRPSGECCCCSELFDADLAIVRTPCGHYYHKKCLGEWLKLAKSCPLCRAILDEASREPEDDPISAEEAAALEASLRESYRDDLAPPARPQEASPEQHAAVETDEAMARRLQEEEISIAGRLV